MTPEERIIQYAKLVLGTAALGLLMYIALAV